MTAPGIKLYHCTKELNYEVKNLGQPKESRAQDARLPKVPLHGDDARDVTRSKKIRQNVGKIEVSRLRSVSSGVAASDHKMCEP